MGAVYQGYCSDMTRTFFLGEPDAKFKEIYTIVRRAQQKAEAGIKAGMMSDAADGLAREVIEAAGYKEAFGHSLGHGVGLAVHEHPSLSPMKERAVALQSRYGGHRGAGHLPVGLGRRAPGGHDPHSGRRGRGAQ